MKTIQVDMFAVGLGASMLVQFALKDGHTVTVLADGGVGTGYVDTIVKDKLPEVLNTFAGDRCRIDLIVGTHYDEDHLKGLVPIIADKSIEIGEVWLPPVRWDADAVPGKIEADDFLAELFFEDETTQALIDYLSRKKERIEELKEIEDKALEVLDARKKPRPAENEQTVWKNETTRFVDQTDLPVAQGIQIFAGFFEEQRKSALKRAGSNSPIHESAAFDSRWPSAAEVLRNKRYRWSWLFADDVDWFMSHYPMAARVIPEALAAIRASEASNAITAIHLNHLVEALRRRDPPIPPRCRFTNEAQPSRFVWSANENRFVRRDNNADAELILTLLGPSDQLIEHHSAKLPVWKLAYAVMLRTEAIPRESISASNQLSYIFTLEMAGQRILISGDAGCYGFKQRRNGYHKNLLAPLHSLNVVQIAHHAGRNYDFYHALVAAGFDKQEARAFLLLSHRIEDKYRPSFAFKAFISRLRRASNEPSLLFTSMPTESKIEEYRELVHPPVSSVASEGDISLSYDSDLGAWRVDRHAIGISSAIAPSLTSSDVALARDIIVKPPLKIRKSKLKEMIAKVLKRKNKPT